jgi:cell wall-associated NlpC family hydrolase
MSEIDAGAITRFVAKQIVTGASSGAPKEEDLAERISEIELKTQILGASYIVVKVIDPGWKLATSGWLDVEGGLLQQIEVEFPEGSGWFWRLCAAEGSTELTQPNLNLTFEDRIVAYLRDYWGPKTVPPGTKTRAEFVRDLVAEVGKHGESKIDFRGSHVTTVQPIETDTEEKTEKLETAADKADATAKANKSSGLTAGSTATVKGQAITASQVAEANTLLGVAHEVDAPGVAVEAAIFAAIAESGLSASADNGTYWGVLSANHAAIPQADTKQMAEAFFKGGKGFVSALTLAKSSSNPVEIAEKAEGVPGSQYESETGYSDFLNEAKAIIAAGGGVSSTSTAESVSDVGQLTRGTTDNPDEDSWEAIARLAGQVTWYAFTNGNSLFYIDGPDMAKQRPALHVEVPPNKVTRANGKAEENVIQTPLTFNFDNTTFEFRKSHKVKGKVQRKSKTSKPSTPAEIRMNLVCDVEDFRAGDCFEYRKSGPCNGRWIVASAIRNCLKDIFTQFVLQPPIEPLPEPQATEKGEETAAAASGVSGSAAAAFNASDTLSQMGLPYLWGGGHGAKGLEGVKAGGPGLDCSGSTCWVLKQAGMFPGSSAEDSTELEKFGEAGKGKEMTVWANEKHAFIEFNIPGHETAQMNTNGPQNGPRLYTLSQTATYNMSPETESFTPRHFPGS